jgi:hypothetical protein
LVETVPVRQIDLTKHRGGGLSMRSPRQSLVREHALSLDGHDGLKRKIEINAGRSLPALGAFDPVGHVRIISAHGTSTTQILAPSTIAQALIYFTPAKHAAPCFSFKFAKFLEVVNGCVARYHLALDSVAPSSLGSIEGIVSVSQKRRRVVFQWIRDDHSNARGHEATIFLDVKRDRHASYNFGGHAAGLGWLVQVFKNNDELVTAQPSDNV